MRGFCKNCNTITDGQSRGDRHFCKECKKFTTKLTQPQPTSTKFSESGYSAEYIVTTEKRIIDEKDIIELCNIDTSIWKIDRYEVGTYEGYRKDRQVAWEVIDGKVTSGKVNDTGKMLVVPLHSVRVWVSRKTAEIRNRLVVDGFIEDAKKFSPTYPKIRYKKDKNGSRFELGLPDLQLGRLVAVESTGNELSPEIQIQKADLVVDELIGYASNFSISRTIFPVGNDFFNSNTAEMMTAHGTPQEDDVRWQRTFKLGCDFLIRTIDKLLALAPVDIVVIPGNHDEERVFYLGEYLLAWYHKNSNVTVDNRPIKRKYYSFGKNLIGFTHGYFEKNGRLDSLMAYEAPQLWANSEHREWHLGDKHHKVDMVLKADEFANGVTVRILRSLATPSVWEFDKGLVGSRKAAEAFIWDINNGVIAQFTSSK